jgi:citrate lyase beta subunit
MVETPHAVMNIKEIAATAYVVPRLEALMMVGGRRACLSPLTRMNTHLRTRRSCHPLRV